jgi:hypothetical protein
MIGNEDRNRSIILTDPYLAGMVSTSAIARILDATLEPDERFLPIEERPSRHRLAWREKRGKALGKLLRA